MSIWTSKRTRKGTFLIGACLLLSACLGLAPQAITVSRGDVTILGPEGYCVDQGASRDAEDGAFVLLASCAAITGSAQSPTPRVPGVLMVTVGPPEGDRVDTRGFGPFFRSAAGRAALSQSGQADTVRVLSTRRSNGVFYLHARDRSEGLHDAVRDEYWRALFDIKGRLVSASVFGTDARPFSSDAGQHLLAEFVARIRAVNQ